MAGSLGIKAFGLAAAALIGILAPLGVEASESVDSLNPLYSALPSARFIPVEGWERVRTPEFPLSRVSGMFVGESRDGKEDGVVVHVLSPGYGGDIALLVAFDLEGRILRVPVVRHEETQCHVAALKDGSFLAQYTGLGIADKTRLRVALPKEGPGDIEAMSGGTVSSRALAEGIAEARIAFYLARSEGVLVLP